MSIPPNSGFSTAKWIVSATAGQGTHTTIAAALTAASAGDTIFIRPGAYTENLTLKAGVNLTAYECDYLTSGQNLNVNIIGKMTATFTGDCAFSGLGFQTNSDYIIEVTGSNVTKPLFTNCYLNCSNNSGFHCTNANATIRFENCQGNIGQAAITYFVVTAGGITINYGLYINSFSTTASTISGGSVSINHTEFDCAISTSNAGSLTGFYTKFSTANTTGVTLAGTGSFTAEHCIFTTGSASAVSIGAGCTGNLWLCEVNSTNTNALTGAGTLNYGGVVFSGSSSTVNTTTAVPTAWPVLQGGTGRTTLTNHGVLVGAATAAITQLAAGSSGQVLQSGGASADPAYSTATYPATATSTGTILRADGTNWVASTPTFPNSAGTSGNVMYSNGTNFISGVPTVASLTTTSNNPVGTTSTAAYKMMGFGSGWKLTPTTYGVIRITIDGQCENNTTGDGIAIKIAYGTGTAPANGDAATGTVIGNTTLWTSLTGLVAQGVPFAKQAIITGLSAGTAYWFDLQLEAITGGTAAVSDLTMTAQEIMS